MKDLPKADPLIRTKLRLPFTRPGLVARPRLHEQIAQGLCGPLTLITAPAGFGKTTLVASSIARCGMPVGWLSLDNNDNQVGRFLNYLVAALRETDSTVGNDAMQLLAGIQPAAPEAIMTSLINDLDAASKDMVFVLDDYQFITSPAVHTAMAFFLEHCPQTLHLLIATRSDPPLPLARLRARGQMVELRAADLRFTPAEAAQFLNDIMGLHLDTGAITALEDRTEGWIAGLQMAALALQGTISMQPYLEVRDRKDVLGFIEGFSGTNRYILDYLLEEVLAHQPPETQRFLLYTSILERLTAPLCDAVLAGDEKPETGTDEDSHTDTPRSESSAYRQLKYLERENLFLISLDDGSASGAGVTWFRYHHLFADLLKARLQQAHPDLVPQLHIRASAWLEQNGFIPEAIQHRFAAHEIDQAADLIERYTPMLWAASDLSVIQLAGSLPYETLIERPRIGVYQAWLLINQGQIEKVLPLLNDLAQRLSGAGPKPEQRWIYTIVRLALAFLIPPANNPEPLPDDQALDEIPADERILRDAAEILYGMALGRRGENDRAIEFSLKSIQKEKMRGGTQVIPTLVSFLTTMYMFKGNLHAAAALCNEYLGPIKEKGIRISTSGNMDVILGYVLYEWNRLDEAEKRLREGLQANQPWCNIMTDAFGMLALTYVLKAKGDYAGAMQIVEKFETRLQGKSRPIEFGEDCRTLRVRVQLSSGDLKTVSEWAEQIRFSPDYQRYPKYYRITLAHIRLAQKRYVDLEETLKEKPSQAGNGTARQLESNLLLAAAYAGQQRLPEAFGLIETCLALAEPEDYIHIFLEVGEPIRELLAAYGQSNAPAHPFFAHKVLDAFTASSGASSPVPQSTGLVEPLSARELEVLQLMALGKTNEDIARQLIVASGTIKAHAASIYRKLDVANRTEAVARARKLGILP